MHKIKVEKATWGKNSPKHGEVPAIALVPGEYEGRGLEECISAEIF